MTDETTQQGASGFEANPDTHSAFPSDSRSLPHEPLDNGADPGENGHSQQAERERVIAAMEAKLDAQRMAEIASVTEGVPAEEVDDEGADAQDIADEEEARVRAELEAEANEADVEEAAAEAQEAGSNDHLPEEYQDDPLADFIVMDEANDTPMFVTKVDGVEKYIPLERARQQLQKHEAAEARLNAAAERQKELDAREAQILASEQALESRTASPKVASPPPVNPDVSDQDLHNEAQSVIQSLFRGTEDEAVASLEQLLKKTSGQPAQQVDVAEVSRQAVATARQELRAEDEQADATAGYKAFQKSYPDIMADKALYRMADGMTDEIITEWKDEGRAFKPSEVMHEAGKRTSEWVQSMKTPGKPTPKPTNKDRHERKRKLRAMPTAQSQKVAVAEQQEPDQTPQDAVNEMRKARGQA